MKKEEQEEKKSTQHRMRWRERDSWLKLNRCVIVCVCSGAFMGVLNV